MTGMERLMGARGTKYLGTFSAVNVEAEVIQIIATGTVITLMTGVDDKGEPVDFKALLGLNAGPALGLGVVIAVPSGNLIKQIQISAGAILHF